MTSEDYSKREIDHVFGDIKKSLERIEEQTTKHNGRLTRLERWMWCVAGAVSVIGFLGVGNIINVVAK